MKKIFGNEQNYNQVKALFKDDSRQYPQVKSEGK